MKFLLYMFAFTELFQIMYYRLVNLHARSYNVRSAGGDMAPKIATLSTMEL